MFKALKWLFSSEGVSIDIRPTVRAMIEAFDHGEITWHKLDRLGISEMHARMPDGAIARISWFSAGRPYRLIFQGSEYGFANDEIQMILKAAVRRAHGMFAEETARHDARYARTHPARISENTGTTQGEPDTATATLDAPDAP